MLGFHFDARNIAQTRNRAISFAFDDDVFELFGAFQTTADIDRQLELHTSVIRCTTNDAGCDLNVLALNGRNHLARGQVTFGNLVGVKPDTHGIIARAKQPDLSDTGDTRQTVTDIQRRVVPQIQHVIAFIG